MEFRGNKAQPEILPLDDDLGDRDLESTLQIARIWTEDEYLAVPDKIYNTFTIDIPWTNVLEQGIAGTQTDSYVLELVGSERFINESLYVGAGDIEWEFTVDPVTWGQPEVLNLNGETISWAQLPQVRIAPFDCESKCLQSKICLQEMDIPLTLI